MKLEVFVIKYRYLVITASILLLIGSVIPMFNMRINPDLETYMPEDMPTIVNNTRMEEIFGSAEPMMIVFEHEDILNQATLERIRDVSKELRNQDAFNQVISLFQIKNIYGENGMMIVDPAVKRIPKTDERRERLRNELKNNDLAYGFVVSEDFRFAMILLTVEAVNQDQEVMDLIHSILETYPGDEEVNIGGQLFLRVEANDKIGRDFIILLPLAILVMLIFLWVSFRELKGMLLPFTVVMISIAACMGMIPLFGWQLSIIGVLIPIMMIAIANNYGVHFIAKYQELNAQNPDRPLNSIIAESVQYLKKPIILTGLTTMVGIIGLIAHILIPAKQMGIVVAIGIGIALVLSLTMVPAVMTMLKKGKVQRSLIQKDSGGPILRILRSLGLLNICCPRIIILFFVIAALAMGAGLLRLEVASDFNNMLPAQHSFNQAIEIADQNFGGTKTILVSFNGDMKDPSILKRMNGYGEELEKLEAVGRVTSLSSVIRIMSQSIYESDEAGYDAIPDNRDAVAQLLELYNMSGDPEDFEQLVDFSYENAVMTVQYQADDLDGINVVKNKVEELTESDSNVSGIAGYSLVEKELCETIAKGQVYSLIIAFVAIILLLILIFKSIKAGLIGSLPLFFAVICTFGLMGWLGIELNIVTALLSSISIGLGVDYTIHMFWRLQTEMRQGTSMSQAIQTSLVTIGRGITINAFAVIVGFSVLFLSGFPLIRTFAFLIIISLFMCLICSLMLIPAVLMVAKTSFLRK